MSKLSTLVADENAEEVNRAASFLALADAVSLGNIYDLALECTSKGHFLSVVEQFRKSDDVMQVCANRALAQTSPIIYQASAMAASKMTEAALIEAGWREEDIESFVNDYINNRWGETPYTKLDILTMWPTLSEEKAVVAAEMLNALENYGPYVPIAYNIIAGYATIDPDQLVSGGVAFVIEVSGEWGWLGEWYRANYLKGLRR